MMGSIVWWDDASIQALNPHIALPHAKIVVVLPSYESDVTFMFTKALSALDGSFANWAGPAASVFPAVVGEQ